MTTIPNTATAPAAFAQAQAAPTRSPSLAAGLLRLLRLFWLCRQIAVHTDAGQIPPKRLLQELGIHTPE
jgi:hypothetical protein